jgi:hypothetical protein
MNQLHRTEMHVQPWNKRFTSNVSRVTLAVSSMVYQRDIRSEELLANKPSTLHLTDLSLRGLPFFALDDKPYCEKDYLVSDWFIVQNQGQTFDLMGSLNQSEHAREMFSLPKSDHRSIASSERQTVSSGMFLLR